MIGDDVLDDVQGAIDADMNGILVKTGKYRAHDEDKLSIPSDSTRFFLANNINEAVDIILKGS